MSVTPRMRKPIFACQRGAIVIITLVILVILIIISPTQITLEEGQEFHICRLQTISSECAGLSHTRCL